MGIICERKIPPNEEAVPLLEKPQEETIPGRNGIAHIIK
jgi:hypothetical protein